jgi:hypothetical protein
VVAVLASISHTQFTLKLARHVTLLLACATLLSALPVGRKVLGRTYQKQATEFFESQFIHFLKEGKELRKMLII